MLLDLQTMEPNHPQGEIVEVYYMTIIVEGGQSNYIFRWYNGMYELPQIKHIVPNNIPTRSYVS